MKAVTQVGPHACGQAAVLVKVEVHDRVLRYRLSHVVPVEVVALDSPVKDRSPSSVGDRAMAM